MSEIDIYVVPPQKYPRSVARDITTTVSTFEIFNVITDFDFTQRGPVWFSFMSDVDWYPIFQVDEENPIDIPDPDPAARGTSVNQCWRVPANFELQRKIDVKTNNFKVIATEDGVLRWHLASIIPPFA